MKEFILNNKTYKFNNECIKNLSEDQLNNIKDIIIGKGYISGVLFFDENVSKVKLQPNGVYTITQFSNSIRATKSNLSKDKFLKDANIKNIENIDSLLMLVRERYNVYHYFNTKYSPKNIQCKQIGKIEEIVDSSNIYTLMAKGQFTIMEISFEIPIEHNKPNATVKSMILYNSKLSMRDIANFM